MRSQDGTTQRQHLERAAQRGHAGAAQELEPPPFPEALRYLYDWASDLYGRSGVGMSGFNPLTYTTISDWSRLTGERPRAHEVSALITLDVVRRFPEAK